MCDLFSDRSCVLDHRCSMSMNVTSGSQCFSSGRVRRLTTAASVRLVGRLQPGTQHVSRMSMSVSSRTNRAPATLLFRATTLRVLSTVAPAQPVTVHSLPSSILTTLTM